jgi:hypothetical protein
MILLPRGEKVILDQDLAKLYGTSTKRLNEQVRRNSKRFPSDFMFQLTEQEVAALRSQNATSKGTGRGGRRYLPLAFTEQGCLRRTPGANEAPGSAATIDRIPHPHKLQNHFGLMSRSMKAVAISRSSGML